MHTRRFCVKRGMDEIGVSALAHDERCLQALCAGSMHWCVPGGCHYTHSVWYSFNPAGIVRRVLCMRGCVSLRLHLCICFPLFKDRSNGLPFCFSRPQKKMFFASWTSKIVFYFFGWLLGCLCIFSTEKLTTASWKLHLLGGWFKLNCPLFLSTATVLQEVRN